MSDVIDSVEDQVFKTDQITGKPTNEVIPLKVKINLQNKLDPDVDIDLQFDKGFMEHQKMFGREFGFSSEEEQTLIMDLVDKINGYEAAGQKYTIFEGFNNTLYMKNMDTAEETFMKLHPNTLGYIKEILTWMYAQEKWIGVPYPGV